MSLERAARCALSVGFNPSPPRSLVRVVIGGYDMGNVTSASENVGLSSDTKMDLKSFG